MGGMLRVRARYVFFNLLRLVFSRTIAQGRFLRRGGNRRDAGTPASRREPTMVRLAYTDPDRQGEPGTTGAAPDLVNRKLGRFDSIAGAMEVLNRTTQADDRVSGRWRRGQRLWCVAGAAMGSAIGAMRRTGVRVPVLLMPGESRSFRRHERREPRGECG